MATQLTLNDGSLNSAGALAIKTNGTTQAINITTGQQVEFNDGSASAPSITNTGDGNTGVFFPDADTVGITTGGTERARVDSSGNLGLGVTPSAWSSSWKAMQLGGGGSLAVWATDAGTNLSANAYNDGSWKRINAATAAQYSMTSTGEHRWNIAGSSTAGSAITFTQAMTLDASGNLGVGTTSPTAILDARGTFAVGPAVGMARIRRNTVSGSNGLTIQGNANDTVSDTNPGAYIAVGGGPLTDGYEGSINLVAYGATTDNNRNQIIFSNRSGVNTVTERARIDSSGNLLVGITSSSNKFIVSTDGIRGHLYVNSSGNVGLYNLGTGTVYSNAGILTNTNPSDSRLKTDVEDLSWGLSQILALRPVSYTWKNNPTNQGTQYGFIAQEVQTVMPELVREFETTDGEETVTRLGLEKDGIHAALVKAIQEQQAIITSLTARIEALEA